MTTSFPIDKAYADDAAKIASARTAGRLHHDVSDIRASGDTVEVATRHFLRRRLPKQYHVGHGHIVDRKLAVSPQLDVILADGNAMPVLFEGENGVQYIPYESVYLIGEVKSSYIRAKNYCHKFVDVQSRLLKDLDRAKTPPNYLGNGISVAGGLSTGLSVPYQNPLFSFMFFADQGDFDADDLVELYSTAAPCTLPNIVVFLDGLAIVQSEVIPKVDHLQLGNLIIDSHSLASDNKGVWCLMRLKGNVSLGGSVLALLILALHVHLSTCRLLNPPIEDYLGHIFKLTTRYGDILDYRKIIEITEKNGIPCPPEIKNSDVRNLIAHLRPLMKKNRSSADGEHHG
jgi:hypothetical protein